MVLRHECAVLRTIKGVLAAGAEPVRPPARPRTPPTRRPCMDSRCCSPIGSPSTFAFLPGPGAGGVTPAEGQPQSVVR